jgi:hypothetical protein
MNSVAMKLINWIIALIIVIASGILCQQIISNSLSNQQDKRDYAELNSVKYGLLSIDEWKRQITEILADEINKLYLSKANERVLRKHIEVLLNTLIDDVDKKIRKENAGTAGGQISQSFINIFINLDEIKKGIPEYAKAVIHEMTKPQSKRQIQSVLNKQLEKYSDQTFDVQGTPQLSLILFRTNSWNIEEARAKLKEEISIKHALIVKEAGLLILLAVILFALSGFSKLPLTPSRYLFLIQSLVALLIAGVTTPTIDMEATISQMNFMLIGHPIHFENQVLYFQSKSILDVFWIMITHKEIQMKLVGILLISFSIVFPLLKIISSLGYYFNFHQLRENAVVRFFVLKSGKWSMADVMVVAIFMAYIGFNGIITSQLGHLSTKGQELVILTTNATALQPGFYLFLTYTLLALILTGFLTRNPQISDKAMPDEKPA